VPLAFWGTTLACGWIQGDYNHLSRMVSELGSIGTRSQWEFTAGLVTCAFLSAAFLAGLLRGCAVLGLSTIPVWLICSFTVSIAGAGTFPLPSPLHLYFGMPSVLLFLSPLTAVLLWPARRAPAHSMGFGLLALGIMCLGFLAFFPEVLPGWTGLKQRFFHAGWSLWFIHLSLGFVARLGDRP